VVKHVEAGIRAVLVARLRERKAVGALGSAEVRAAAAALAVSERTVWRWIAGDEQARTGRRRRARYEITETDRDDYGPVPGLGVGEGVTVEVGVGEPGEEPADFGGVGPFGLGATPGRRPGRRCRRYGRLPGGLTAGWVGGRVAAPEPAACSRKRIRGLRIIEFSRTRKPLLEVVFRE
jgi:hypothetical protein